MRFFLVAVAVAVLPSAFSFPVFKRSDTSLDGKDQKSERKTKPWNIGGKFHIEGNSCQAGAGNFNFDSTITCNYGQGAQQESPNPNPFGQESPNSNPFALGPFDGPQGRANNPIPLGTTHPTRKEGVPDILDPRETPGDIIPNTQPNLESMQGGPLLGLGLLSKLNMKEAKPKEPSSAS